MAVRIKDLESELRDMEMQNFLLQKRIRVINEHKQNTDRSRRESKEMLEELYSSVMERFEQLQEENEKTKAQLRELAAEVACKTEKEESASCKKLREYEEILRNYETASSNFLKILERYYKEMETRREKERQADRCNKCRGKEEKCLTTINVEEDEMSPGLCPIDANNDKSVVDFCVKMTSISNKDPCEEPKREEKSTKCSCLKNWNIDTSNCEVTKTTCGKERKPSCGFDKSFGGNKSSCGKEENISCATETNDSCVSEKDNTFVTCKNISCPTVKNISCATEKSILCPREKNISCPIDKNNSCHTDKNISCATETIFCGRDKNNSCNVAKNDSCNTTRKPSCYVNCSKDSDERMDCISTKSTRGSTQRHDSTFMTCNDGDDIEFYESVYETCVIDDPNDDCDETNDCKMAKKLDRGGLDGCVRDLSTSCNQVSRCARNERDCQPEANDEGTCNMKNEISCQRCNFDPQKAVQAGVKQVLQKIYERKASREALCRRASQEIQSNACDSGSDEDLMEIIKKVDNETRMQRSATPEPSRRRMNATNIPGIVSFNQSLNRIPSRDREDCQVTVEDSFVHMVSSKIGSVKRFVGDFLKAVISPAKPALDDPSAWEFQSCNNSCQRSSTPLPKMGCSR